MFIYLFANIFNSVESIPELYTVVSPTNITNCLQNCFYCTYHLFTLLILWAPILILVEHHITLSL